MVDLSGKAALVTGGATGIGYATVVQLLMSGATVAVNYMGADEKAHQAICELQSRQPNVIGAPGDVSIPEEASTMVQRAVSDMGRLDILVNNAGTAGTSMPIPFDDLEAMTVPFWDRILDTNLKGTFWCARAAAHHLKNAEGSIVNVASIAGLGHPGSSIAYGASKAGVINLTRSLARALAPSVRVNAVAPGHVRTPWTNAWPEAWRDRFQENALLHRLVDAADVAQAIVFLASNRSVTAQTIVVDCGRTA